ncbi:hypothetical protein ACMATS_05990 [Streptoverticillium reticulum]|uniref:hypothetical protein n=1 Tax=Streptoverticillium reticulum TaxID=1433415 RepID=UPI0039BFBC49
MSWMHYWPALAALCGALLAVIALGVRHAGDEAGTHPSLSPVGTGLLSSFVLLTGFLVAAGWAIESHAANYRPAPSGLYYADTAAAALVVIYPALASLPLNWRHVMAVAGFGALVGYLLAVAWQLKTG